MRNLGDGFDDEECPERESWKWEMRSTRAPGSFLLFWGEYEVGQGSRFFFAFFGGYMRSTRALQDIFFEGMRFITRAPFFLFSETRSIRAPGFFFRNNPISKV